MLPSWQSTCRQHLFTLATPGVVKVTGVLTMHAFQMDASKFQTSLFTHLCADVS